MAVGEGLLRRKASRNDLAQALSLAQKTLDIHRFPCYAVSIGVSIPWIRFPSCVTISPILFRLH